MTRCCKLCRRPARSLTRAHVMAEGGGLEGGLVCQRCAKRGVLLVPALPAKVSDGGKAERRSTAEVLAPFVRSIEAKMKALKAFIPGTVSSEDMNDAKVETLEGVLHMLKEQRA